MVIKNKDGTIYKISEPNPLMNQQDFWGDYKKHNFDWLPDIVKDGSFKIFQDDNSKEIKIEIKKEQEQIPKKPEEFQKETDNVKIIEKKVNISNNKNIKMTACYCLPAKDTQRKDSLYDEIYYKTEYLDKTMIEIVILEKDDLFIKIWCNEKLTEKSILYPRNKDKRWWKISESSNAPIGYYYMAGVSDYTPSFE